MSTLIAALPVIVLLGALGIFRMKAHVSALLGLAVALAAATNIHEQIYKWRQIIAARNQLNFQKKR